MYERQKKISREEKLWIAKEYLDGKGSTYSLAEKYGVTDTTIRRWAAEHTLKLC